MQIFIASRYLNQKFLNFKFINAVKMKIDTFFIIIEIFVTDMFLIIFKKFEFLIIAKKAFPYQNLYTK